MSKFQDDELTGRSLVKGWPAWIFSAIDAIYFTRKDQGLRLYNPDGSSLIFRKSINQASLYVVCRPWEQELNPLG